MAMPPKEKIKILYGLESADGGSLKHLTYLVTNLNKSKFDFTVIISPRSENAYECIAEMHKAGAKIILLSMQREVNLWKDLVSLFKIYRHLRNHNYDIVHSHSSKAGVLFRVAAWIKRVPLIIYTPHCFYFQGKTGLKRKFYSWVEKVLGELTDFIVVSNTEKACAQEQKIVHPRKLLNINNAIDFKEYPFYNSENIKREMKIDSRFTIVGSVGRLTEQKDWFTYIYAAAETLKSSTNVLFLIVGAGELIEDVKKAIEKLGIADRVIVTGHNNEISKIYSIIDLFVSTSLWEGLPYVFLEAMWFKKPIIATDLRHAGIIYDKENGYLVPTKDYRLLTNKIIELVKDKTLRTNMGECGHQLVKNNFSFIEFVRQHESLYLNKHSHNF